jgi:hypothetical protein
MNRNDVVDPDEAMLLKAAEDTSHALAELRRSAAPTPHQQLLRQIERARRRRNASRGSNSWMN